jgi:hypothetical protein
MLLIVFTLCVATACDNQAYYKNAAEFEAVVQSWQLDGKLVSEVFSILTNKGFICKDQHCELHVGRFPCSQTQNISLVVSNDNKVIKTSVRKHSDGELPSVCL